jgi:drug/metabolite transporter (DMT)-like permease
MLPAVLSSTQAAGGVLYAETVLSLYPQLVKIVKEPLSTQVAVRCFVFSVLALAIGGIGSLAKAFTGVGGAATFFGLGAINLLHVWSSYYAFQKLPSGVALTLFYTYPILNILGAWLFFGQSVGLKAIPFFLLAMVGVYMVASASGTMKAAASDKEGFEDKTFDFKGILAAFGAALTETSIYLILYGLRAEKGASMFSSIHRVYTSSALLLLPFLGSLIKLPDMKGLSIMGLWNSLLGFTGYSARFAAIPVVSPVIYSALSLFGIFASYIWGWLFGRETITAKGLVGSGLVGLSVFLMRQFGGFSVEV